MGKTGSYAADVTPQAAPEGLARIPDTCLLHVGTQPEWSVAGIPGLSGIRKTGILAAWWNRPAMAGDLEFMRPSRVTGLTPA